MPSYKLIRGDLVLYKGGIYYFQPNGSSCYLYKNKEDVGDISKKIYAPRKTSVEKYIPESVIRNNNNLLPVNEKIRPSYVKAEEPQTSALTYNTLSQNIKILTGYVYFGKDITDSRHLYKIGQTKNLQNRLKKYKTGQPNFEYIIKIRTENRTKLETKLINVLKTCTKAIHEGGENYIIRIKDIKILLQKAGLSTNNDGIYIDPIMTN